jgi:hypothetical protein
MKTISIQFKKTKPAYIPQEKDWDFCIWRQHFIDFVLSFLSLKKNGTIYASADGSSDNIKIFYSSDSKVIFQEPVNSENILEIDLLHFRSFLAHLGFLLINETHFGAGTFKLSLKDSNLNSEETLYALVFSNTEETGVWFKLHVCATVSKQESV